MSIFFERRTRSIRSRIPEMSNKKRPCPHRTRDEFSDGRGEIDVGRYGLILLKEAALGSKNSFVGFDGLPSGFI